MEATKAADGLGLHARGAQQVLHVGEVGGELGKLGVEMGLGSRKDVD